MRTWFRPATPDSIPEKRKERATQKSRASNVRKPISLILPFLDSFNEQFAYPAFIAGLDGEAQAAQGDRFTDRWNDLEGAKGKTCHGFHTRSANQRGIFAAEIIDCDGAGHAPFVVAQAFDHCLAAGRLGQFPDDLRDNILDRDDARCCAKFIQNDGHAAFLALQAFKKLQKIHALRHK